jgi:hypothetical protein
MATFSVMKKAKLRLNFHEYHFITWQDKATRNPDIAQSCVARAYWGAQTLTKAMGMTMLFDSTDFTLSQEYLAKMAFLLQSLVRFGLFRKEDRWLC